MPLYRWAVPVNPLTNASVVADGTTAVAGSSFVFDYNGGIGSGVGDASATLRG